MLHSRGHRRLLCRTCIPAVIAFTLGPVVCPEVAADDNTFEAAQQLVLPAQGVETPPPPVPPEANANGSPASFPDGLIHFQQGHFDVALDAFQQLDTSVASYYEGLCLMELDRPAEAAVVFESLRDDPSPPEKLELDLGIALLDSGRAAASVPLLTAYVGKHPRDAEARSHLEAAISNSGPNSAAREQAVQQQPTQQTMQIPMLAPDMFNAAPERNWNLSLLNGYEYDSNLVLAPEFSGLGSGVQREDSRWVTALNGDYRLFQEEDIVVGVMGSVLQTAQFAMHEFNVSNFMGGAYVNQVFHDDWLAGLNYQYQKTLLQGNHLAGEHRVVASLTHLDGDDGHTTVYYEFDDSDLDAPALIPAQERSGFVNAAGITQAFYLMEGDGRLFVGYRYSNRDADGSDFDFNSQMVTGRVEIPWFNQANDTVVDAEVRYFVDDYDNANSLDFFGSRRHDDRVEVRAGLQKFLTDYLSVRLDYTLTDSESNVANLFGVEFYSYVRHVFSTQLIYEY